MRIAILAAGVERDDEFCRAQLEKADKSICADGGYRTALRLGWKPDAVVGDFDSIPPEEAAALETEGVEAHRSPAEKDQSDLELAIDMARTWQAQEIVLLGALEGRLDHLLFNLVAGLEYAHRIHLKARLVSSTAEAFLVSDHAEITGRPERLCSLFSLEPETTGITLEGFKYPLYQESLFRHRSRGLSNVIQSDRATIKVGSGLLLAILVNADCSSRSLP
jgi:thiamine pyrophosphokinase